MGKGLETEEIFLLLAASYVEASRWTSKRNNTGVVYIEKLKII